MADANIKMPKLNDSIEITVYIKNFKWWKFKIWVAVQLVKLGCRIGSFGFKQTKEEYDG